MTTIILFILVAVLFIWNLIQREAVKMNHEDIRYLKDSKAKRHEIVNQEQFRNLTKEVKDEVKDETKLIHDYLGVEKEVWDEVEVVAKMETKIFPPLFAGMPNHTMNNLVNKKVIVQKAKLVKKPEQLVSYTGSPEQTITADCSGICLSTDDATSKKKTRKPRKKKK